MDALIKITFNRLLHVYKPLYHLLARIALASTVAGAWAIRLFGSVANITGGFLGMCKTGDNVPPKSQSSLDTMVADRC